MLELNRLDLEEIATAMADQTDYEHRWLINPETGDVVFWTSDTGIDGQTPVDLDELDLICIDPLPSYIELHEEYPHLLPAWYAFRDARGHRRAVEWLADNSLIDDNTATRFLDEHPEPDAP